MNKTFVKKSQLKVVNGGYLVTGKDEKPVTHEGFVAAQKRAEYVITFANLAKDKDFKGKEAYSLSQLKSDVNKTLSSKGTTYVETKEVSKGELTEKLATEALAWINGYNDNSNAEKINKFLQEFNVINEFEEFGLYFDEGIVKLNKIYTIEEIKEAVKSVIELL